MAASLAADGPLCPPTKNELAKKGSQGWAAAKENLAQLEARSTSCPQHHFRARRVGDSFIKLTPGRPHSTDRRRNPRGFLYADHWWPANRVNPAGLILSWMLHPNTPSLPASLNRVARTLGWIGQHAIRLRQPWRMPTHPELLDWLARWFIQDGGA